MYEDLIISQMFSGIIFVLFIFGLIYVIWGNSLKLRSKETDIEIRILALEQTLIDKVAGNRDINLAKELVKQSSEPRREFRKRLYEEVIKEMFDKDKKEKS